MNWRRELRVLFRWVRRRAATYEDPASVELKRAMRRHDEAVNGLINKAQRHAKS